MTAAQHRARRQPEEPQTLKTRLQVQVQLPVTFDPAQAGSLQHSLQKAVDLLALTDTPWVDTADRLAQMVVGIAEPDTELLADRIHRMKTVRQVFAQGEWLTAEEINRLQVSAPSNKALPASDWKRRGRVFAVPYNGKEYFGRFQFDAMYQPLPVMRRVLEAFGEVADPWVLAAWFHYPNGWLSAPKADGGVTPVAPSQALDRGDEVVAAARRRRESFVA